MTVTGDGEPVEFLIAPGVAADISIFRELNFDLPHGSEIFTDKAYNDYNFEDMLYEAVGITLKLILKKKKCTKCCKQRGETRNHCHSHFDMAKLYASIGKRIFLL